MDAFPCPRVHDDHAVFRRRFGAHTPTVIAGLEPAIELPQQKPACEAGWIRRLSSAKTRFCPRMTSFSCLSPQAIWSTRVPCPGGSGACTVCCDALASSPSPSTFTSGPLGSLASGAFIWTGGGLLEMLEILMIDFPEARSRQTVT